MRPALVTLLLVFGMGHAAAARMRPPGGGPTVDVPDEQVETRATEGYRVETSEERGAAIARSAAAEHEAGERSSMQRNIGIAIAGALGGVGLWALVRRRRR